MTLYLQCKTDFFHHHGLRDQLKKKKKSFSKITYTFPDTQPSPQHHKPPNLASPRDRHTYTARARARENEERRERETQRGESALCVYFSNDPDPSSLYISSVLVLSLSRALAAFSLSFSPPLASFNKVADLLFIGIARGKTCAAGAMGSARPQRRPLLSCTEASAIFPPRDVVASWRAVVWRILTISWECSG